MDKGLGLLGLIFTIIFLSSCATVFPPYVNYDNVKLMFSDNIKGESDIYNGKAVFAVYLSGSPESQKTLGKSYQCSIFMSNADGTNQKRLTYGICEDSPTWTKDGDIVYLGGEACSGNQWYLIDMDGDQPKGTTEISSRIAKMLIEKQMTGDEARRIRYK